jgi:hypothetical protein
VEVQLAASQVCSSKREEAEARGRKGDTFTLPVENCDSSVGILLVLVKECGACLFAIENGWRFLHAEEVLNHGDVGGTRTICRRITPGLSLRYKSS